MSETIKSIIFGVIGLIIVVVGICTDAGWEVIGLGAASAVVSAICVIYDHFKAKKK